jgi:hypothetical protein
MAAPAARSKRLSVPLSSWIEQLAFNDSDPAVIALMCSFL